MESPEQAGASSEAASPGETAPEGAHSFDAAIAAAEAAAAAAAVQSLEGGESDCMSNLSCCSEKPRRARFVRCLGPAAATLLLTLLLVWQLRQTGRRLPAAVASGAHRKGSNLYPYEQRDSDDAPLLPSLSSEGMGGGTPQGAGGDTISSAAAAAAAAAARPDDEEQQQQEGAASSSPKQIPSGVRKGTAAAGAQQRETPEETPEMTTRPYRWKVGADEDDEQQQQSFGAAEQHEEAEEEEGQEEEDDEEDAYADDEEDYEDDEDEGCPGQRRLLPPEDFSLAESLSPQTEETEDGEPAKSFQASIEERMGYPSISSLDEPAASRMFKHLVMFGGAMEITRPLTVQGDVDKPVLGTYLVTCDPKYPLTAVESVYSLQKSIREDVATLLAENVSNALESLMFSEDSGKNPICSMNVRKFGHLEVQLLNSVQHSPLDAPAPSSSAQRPLIPVKEEMKVTTTAEAAEQIDEKISRGRGVLTCHLEDMDLTVVVTQPGNSGDAVPFNMDDDGAAATRDELRSMLEVKIEQVVFAAKEGRMGFASCYLYRGPGIPWPTVFSLYGFLVGKKSIRRGS